LNRGEIIKLKTIFIEFHFTYKKSKNGDWGLGIGDWAQSPIPNPQKAINTFFRNLKIKIKIISKNIKIKI
jgi:hypothetical protein